jgi:hypothetical protein
MMHAKPGLGKRFAARALLENFYVFLDRNLKGFMVTPGTDLNKDHFLSLASLLGVQNVQGWIHVFLLAVDAPKKKQPNILILDGFNSAAENNIKFKFVKKFYGEINIDKNLFVMVRQTLRTSRRLENHPTSKHLHRASKITKVARDGVVS